jgi:phospholipase/carboxylesterase
MAGQFSLVHAVREPTERSVTPPPVLLLLHGVGSNEQDLMALAPMLDHRFFVISTRAPFTLQHGSYAWYHVQFTPTGQIMNPEEAEASRFRILHFIDEVNDSYNVDPERMFIMGFSQGCIMSVAAALTEPQRFAGVVGMSGRLLPGIVDKAAPADELRGLPVFISHGTADQVLGIEYGRALNDALERLPVNLTYREYPMGHHVSNQSLSDIERWLSERLDSQEDWRNAPA